MLCLCAAFASCDSASPAPDPREISEPAGTATVSYLDSQYTWNAYYTVGRASDEEGGEDEERVAFFFVDGSPEGYAGFQRALLLRHEDLASPQVGAWAIGDTGFRNFFHADFYPSEDGQPEVGVLGSIRITEVAGDEVRGTYEFYYYPSERIRYRVLGSFAAVPYSPGGD